MSDQIKNALIGLFVISALAILGFTLMFLHPQTSDEGQLMKVRFSNIDKITVGTRVTFAGKPVGQVIKIMEVEAPRAEKYFGDYVYPYELLLAVDSSVHVYNSDEVALRTSGLLGERSVAITPRKPKKGIRLRRVGPNDILYATEVGSLEETFAEFNNFAERAEETFDALMDMLEDVKQHNVWEYIGKTAENLSDITTALNSPDDWSDMLTNFRAFSDKANTLVDRVSDTWDNVDETFQNAATATSNFAVSSADVKILTTKTASGEGTLGRLFVRDDIYLNANALMSKVQTIADDVNHYGILFHNDPSWQRLRARRMNLLMKLRCPQEFRNFFEDEIDNISTSLSRVSIVMDETSSLCCPEDFLSDCDYVRLFADLLRRIESLGENIKMYNEQLVDLHENSCCH
ncbi:MAG: MlaD family protein [Chlamydiales bacterium]|nr:MlaD family protein [Chlamydiales bacterium]